MFSETAPWSFKTLASPNNKLHIQNMLHIKDYCCNAFNWQIYQPLPKWTLPTIASLDPLLSKWTRPVRHISIYITLNKHACKGWTVDKKKLV